jgi:undecaprenyl-diphosphatase
MAIPLPEVLLLGVVQGVASVFPISSDGHLALLQMLLGSEADAATSVFLYLGTLAAIVLVLRKRVTSALVEGTRGVLHPSLLKDTQGGRDAVTVVLATIPTAVLSLSLKGLAELWSSSPTMVGACCLASALALGSTYWAPRGEKDTPSPLGAVLMGVAQGCAVLPGFSRTAATLAVLLWVGVRGERALELSFLAAIPAICGAALLEARHGLLGDDSDLVLCAGTAVTLVFGLLAFRILRSLVARRVVSVFALYLVPLGVATVAWGYARP